VVILKKYDHSLKDQFDAENLVITTADILEFLRN
jgi:hypothetical protein